jgi:hypothetical protein
VTILRVGGGEVRDDRHTPVLQLLLLRRRQPLRRRHHARVDHQRSHLIVLAQRSGARGGVEAHTRMVAVDERHERRHASSLLGHLVGKRREAGEAAQGHQAAPKRLRLRGVGRERMRERQDALELANRLAQLTAPLGQEGKGHRGYPTLAQLAVLQSSNAESYVPRRCGQQANKIQRVSHRSIVRRKSRGVRLVSGRLRSLVEPRGGSHGGGPHERAALFFAAHGVSRAL